MVHRPKINSSALKKCRAITEFLSQMSKVFTIGDEEGIEKE